MKKPDYSSEDLDYGNLVIRYSFEVVKEDNKYWLVNNSWGTI